MALNQVLVNTAGNEPGGSGGAGDFADPGEVPDGTLAFFPPGDANSVDISSGTGNAFTDYSMLQAVVGNDQGPPRRTNPFDPTETQVHSLAFQSGQVNKWEVDIATVSSETYLGVKITSEEEGSQPYPQRTATLHADSSMSAQAIAQDLADKINEWEEPIHEGATGVTGDMDVTASASSGVLTISAENVGDFFHVATVGEYTPNSVTETQNPTQPSGTGSQVIEMEESVFGILGRTQVDDGILGRQPDPRVFADASNDYDLITLRVETNYDKSINPANRFQDIKLALETGVNKTNINSFLGTSL